MTGVSYDYAIIGGDLRQVYLAEQLRKSGYSVITYGINSAGDVSGCDQADCMKQALNASVNIVLPIPVTHNQNTLLHKSGLEDLTLELLKEHIKTGQELFGGCIPDDIKKTCEKKSIKVHDFMKDDPIAIFNSIATAEGVIAEAIINHPSNLHDSCVLVLGYGRCGKTLAYKLSGLSKEVAVCARKELPRAEAEAFGHQVISFEQLKEKIEQFDLIFNTVPDLLLDREQLKHIRPGAMILDLATAPGGVDFEAAQEAGINARLFPGLPGKYAPKSSAQPLADYLIAHKRIHA